MRTDKVSWTAAILLSLIAHGALFIHGGARPGAERAPVSQSLRLTRLSFNRPAEMPVPEAPHAIEKPPDIPAEKAPAKPRAKIRPGPAQAIRKVQRAGPVEKKEALAQATSPPPVQGRQVSRATDGLLQARRRQYLHELLSHIESYRFYPRAARRRSIQGDVNISFRLRDDGRYEQLELDGNESVLVSAAQQALESAVPLPAPPDGIGLSGRIEFTMAYSLTR